MKKEKISKLYYLLAIMPCGLPISLLRLFYPDIESYIYEEDKKISLKYQDRHDNWYYVYEQYKQDICNFASNKIKEECINNCLKVFARLLYFYIKKDQEKILFPDTNIRYLFNSYNGKNIWKTFNEEIYKKCFPYEYINRKIDYRNDVFENEEKEYSYIIQNDFDIDKYKENILYFIENYIEFIKISINKNINKEYLEQILLMLPSCYLFTKQCKIIIKECIKICSTNDLSLALNDEKMRLLLFLYSLEEKPNFNPEDFSKSYYKELYAEAYFLYGLKYNDIKSFKISINLYDNLYKKSYAYYEIGLLYYIKKEYEQSKFYLNEATKSDNYLLNNRCKIDLAILLYKQTLENKSNKEKKKFEIIPEIDMLLKDVIFQRNEDMKKNNKLKSAFQQEALNIKIKLNKYSEPDIIILSSNPLVNYNSPLNSGIYAYHNNHYYLLQQLYEKINLNIKVECNVLNQINLNTTAFDKEGKILIIQSDDFTEDGEIVLESEIGESIILPKDQIKNSLPEKLKYNIVILCFINSSELEKLFKNKCNYLITFEKIKYEELDSDTLLKYNELSINFLINFIEKTIVKSIKISFKVAHDIFYNGINKKLNMKKYINLIEGKDQKINEYIKYEKNNIINKEGSNIFLYYPLINLNPNSLRNKDYSDYILASIIKIIKAITNNNIISSSIFSLNPNIISANKIDDISQTIQLRIIEERFYFMTLTWLEDTVNEIIINKYVKQIGIEIMRFFHRHHTFNQLFCIFNHHDIRKIRKEINNNETDNEILILVYNNKKNLIDVNEDPLEEFNNVKYLIINNYDIITNREEFNNNIIRRDNKINKNEIKKNILDDLESIFTYQFNQNNDNLSDKSDSDN